MDCLSEHRRGEVWNSEVFADRRPQEERERRDEEILGCEGRTMEYGSTQDCHAKGCQNFTRVECSFAPHYVLIYGDRDTDEIPGEKFEHLAGPECVCSLGYSGYRISAEEMRVRLFNPVIPGIWTEPEHRNAHGCNA